MSDLDNNTTMEREDFFNVATKELKEMYRSSHTIITFCILWSSLLFLATAAVIITSFVNSTATEMRNFLLFAFLFYLLPLYVLIGPAIIGGIKRTGWGRAWGMGICFLMVTGFPIGTILSFIGLRAYKRKELFGKQEILHADLKKEVLYRKQNNID